jgi:hypothetical protein
MREGTIGIDKSRGVIGWAIKRVTGKPWGHSKTYLRGFTFESTVWWVGYCWRTGIKMSIGQEKADECWQLKIPMTLEQERAELAYWISKLNKRRPYNVPKLLVLAIVIPHRKFFERLGWVPFDNERLGEVCSASCDEGKKAAGLDLLPGRMEGYTAPGDFRESPLLEVVA